MHIWTSPLEFAGQTRTSGLGRLQPTCSGELPWLKRSIRQYPSPALCVRTSIAAAQVVFLPFILDIEDELLKTCQCELKIPIVAFSPLCHGPLTGQIVRLSWTLKVRVDDFSEYNFRNLFRGKHKDWEISEHASMTPTGTA